MNLLLAQSTSESSTSLEFDWPLSAADWTLWGAIVLATLYTAWIVYRDTRQLSSWVTAVLIFLRLSVIAGLGLIALNPHLKTQSEIFRPSQVLLLVDTSKSMQQPEKDPRESQGQELSSRADAVRKLLADSNLLKTLQAEHNVDLYTFDDDLSEVRLRLEQLTASTTSEVGEADSSQGKTPDWSQLLEPSGLSTRLGDSLDTLLTEARSPTLAGIVVISDGASNAGRDWKVPHDRAESLGIRLVTVGVGSERPPVNLELAKVIAPTEVQKGDAFDITAYLQGVGIDNQQVSVELVQKEKATGHEESVDRKNVSVVEGVPQEVTFSRTPIDAGEYEFTVKASLDGIPESRAEDNQQTRTVSVFDRPLKVLIIAGGPMREYLFSRTALHRHSAFEIDVWLQSGKVGISQDAKNLLFRFPESQQELYQYDVLLAFDPDWEQIPREQLDLLDPWISSEGGGMVFVAGDIFTRRLTSSDDRLQVVRRLLPIVLDESGFNVTQTDQFKTAYPVGLTQEGEAAGFLSLDENLSPLESWKSFEGVFRCYPTRGRKAGAVVYAEFTDPLSRGPDGQPALIADQRYGQGHVLYLGSPELWRLRSVDDEYYERFWTKLVRKASEGRSKRGIQQGMFILEGRDFDVGQSIPLRARAVTAQFTPLELDELTLDVTNPQGRLVLPPVVLRRDRNRPTEFTGDLHAVMPGVYRLEFVIPDTNKTVSASVSVQLPQLEASSLVQNSRSLKALADGTGGSYVALAEAVNEIPRLLPNRSRREVIDERIQEVWDRQWVMFLLAILFSMEWLLRKLVKLA